ncbi:hypothetical protein [Nocardia sp. NPDC052112]|uniref:hypothetical protein n=1 Tax=Nocardia sp. NPDC052112 TaxID=3155646 RepID=UPI0034410270
MSTPEPIHDLARGDVAVSRQLGRALRTLMNGTSDPRLKDQLRGVIEGKGSARELLRSNAFNQVLDRTLPAAMRRFAEMPEHERQRLAAEGEAELTRLRKQPPQEQAPAATALPTDRTPTPPPEAPRQTPPAPTAGVVLPGTRKPDRDRVVTPDEPDDDDLYYRERQQRGWLV